MWNVSGVGGLITAVLVSVAAVVYEAWKGRGTDHL
jgi:hypothetical protein